MGRSEWLYKAGGGGDGSGGGGGGTSQTTKPPVKKKTTRRDKRNNSSSGCMTAIFNLFDIQNHQFRFHHPSFMSESAINNNPQPLSNVALQGVEAPRNSLQSPESMVEVAPPPSSSSSKAKKEQTNLNIPMGGIQIKTKLRSDDLSSECSSSPGTKTPNLVARLMGLDLLPEYSSPRPSSSSSTTPAPVNYHHRTRSLPATPRISTASRRSTDNDYHHRLSLQIDKENCNMTCRVQEHESLQMKMARRRSELLTVNRQDDDDRTSQYAKQIANQVRERISRRLGTDITNTISPARLNNEQRRDSNLVLLKPKKQPSSAPAPEPAKKTKRDDSIPFSSSSPKLRLLDINNNLNRPISYSQSQPKPESTAKLHETPLMKLEKVAVRDQKCNKKIASERYDLRLKKMHPQPQDEVFVNKITKKKKKSTPLPNHVMTNSTKKFLSFKKEMASSSSSTSTTTTRLPQKQVSLMSMTQLPSNLKSSYNSNTTNHTLNLSVQDSTAATSSSATTGRRRYSVSDHFDVYISRIINHCGIHSTTPISIAQWYSPSHPLHPSIFHQLEKLFYSTATATTAAGTAGRRMVFELVDEFLVEMVKPAYYMNHVKPCGLMYCGSELIGKLCERMKNIPAAANCEVLEDIDGLIERDIGRSMRRLLTAAIESEAEEIVKEIEGEIVETMVHEMVISLTA